jgi:hypothetical protein
MLLLEPLDILEIPLDISSHGFLFLLDLFKLLLRSLSLGTSLHQH